MLALYDREHVHRLSPRGAVDLTVLPPDDALDRALPAPNAQDLEIEGLTDQEWTAFQQALSDR